MGKLRVLIFIFIRFFGAYGLMLFIYQKYLDKNKDLHNFIDPATKELSIQVSYILNQIGMNNHLVPIDKEERMGIYLEKIGNYIVYINEGCNAISVMVIFVAFAITFYSSFFKTFAYIIFGLSLLYISNLFRIILLTIIFYKYTAYAQFSHDIVFPIIIYGMVILLWVLWLFYLNPSKNKINENS